MWIVAIVMQVRVPSLCLSLSLCLCLSVFPRAALIFWQIDKSKHCRIGHEIDTKFCLHIPKVIWVYRLQCLVMIRFWFNGIFSSLIEQQTDEILYLISFIFKKANNENCIDNINWINSTACCWKYPWVQQQQLQLTYIFHLVCQDETTNQLAEDFRIFVCVFV